MVVPKPLEMFSSGESTQRFWGIFLAAELRINRRGAGAESGRAIRRPVKRHSAPLPGVLSEIRICRTIFTKNKNAHAAAAEWTRTEAEKSQSHGFI